MKFIIQIENTIIRCYLSFIYISRMLIKLLASVLIYIGIIWFIWHGAIERELLDLNCPDGPNTKDKNVCRDGNGKLWANYKYVPGESVKASLAKLKILNRNWGHPVIWRRCLIMAFMASLLVWIITHQKIPDGFELVGSMLAIFIVWYLAHSFFGFHHDRFIEDTISEHLQSLFSHLPDSANINLKNTKSKSS